MLCDVFELYVVKHNVAYNHLVFRYKKAQILTKYN